ncbi:MAG: L-seryl-tRNA(Sec) selenium transferase [Gemmatimonadales bacterium]
MTDPRRDLPSVNALLESASMVPLLQRAPRTVVVQAIRAAIDEARREPAAAPDGDDAWARRIEAVVTTHLQPSLRAVFNATGVILHTNLGRAPLAEAAVRAIQDTAGGYSNLEYDIDRGERGSRYVHSVALLRELTGAADAIVVNNCAAGLVLALNTIARGREVLVSRGELIEIGGSFRVPEIMAKSGARLVEVGSTNRTHPSDYTAAMSDRVAAIVKVHRSNFTVEGFVAEASVEELASLARDRQVPVLHDLGSGLLTSLERYGLAGEPTARDAITAGASLVFMSGDKLLGGPQAGIVAGDPALIARLRSNPLARALRVDKLTLAALQATLALYRDPETVVRSVPVLAMLTAPVAAIRARAEAIATRLRGHGIEVTVGESTASVGGGAFPAARIASAVLSLAGDPVGTETRLRMGQPPVVGRIADGTVMLDLRSVPAVQDAAFGDALVRALS